jgi:hypothetical protein
VEVDDPGAFEDIDTPGDYANLQIAEVRSQKPDLLT